MVASTLITSIRQYTLGGPHSAFKPTPAGSIGISGTAEIDAEVVVTDTQSDGKVYEIPTIRFGTPVWALPFDGRYFDPLPAGTYTLIATSYASGYPGPAGPSSDPVTFLVGTDGADALTGPVLSTGITGPKFVFGGPGNDTFTPYSVVADATGHHVSGAAVTVDGGGDVNAGPGVDTVVLPVALAGLEGHVRHGGTQGTPASLDLITPDATVTTLGIEKLQFADLTLTVQHDPLVDFLFYDTRYRDVAVLDLNVSNHYEIYGWREGRDPNAFFSTLGYESAYADTRGAGVSPLVNYEDQGWREGRDPSASFDTKLYLIFNPDVAAVGINPLEHYLNWGIGEGRKSSPVVASGLVQDGFDPLYYKLANSDVGFSNMDPLAHYETFGWREGRNPDAFFDTNWYFAHNPDVAAAGVNPLAHYEVFGWREGRDPSSHFNTQRYLAANPDVAAAGIDPLDHFLQFGVAEGRSAHGDLF